MLRRLSVVSLLVMSFVLCNVPASARQDNYNRYIRKFHERPSPPANENKLSGGLSFILWMSEQADTSSDIQAQLSKVLSIDKDLHADSLGQIRVGVELRKGSNKAGVVEFIRSVGGTIERMYQIPYLTIRIKPKFLRTLISSNSIIRINVEFPPTLD